MGKYAMETRTCQVCGKTFEGRKSRASHYCSPKCRGIARSKDHTDEMIGKRYARLVIVARAESSRFGQARFLCKCDCGNTSIAYGSNLSRGHTTSCGCVANEHRGNAQRTHGQSNTRLYEVWQGMLSRCEKEYSTVYSFYGGRGIRVCNEWHHFEPFHAWATENGYADDLTLDRIDPNGNYEPTNCRWATRKEQANNKRTSRLICVDGVIKTQSEWAKIIGVSHGAIIQARKRGVDIADYIRAKM